MRKLKGQEAKPHDMRKLKERKAEPHDARKLKGQEAKPHDARKLKGQEAEPHDARKPKGQETGSMRRFMRWSAILGGFFIAVALSVVIHLGLNRAVVIVDAGTAMDASGVSGKGSLSASQGLPGQAIGLQESGGEERSFRIPVETVIGPENITVENRYADRLLILSLRGASGAFYKESELAGNTSLIQEASYTVDEEGVVLYLQFSELYEYESILETGYLQFTLYRPSELYEKVVVLDAGLSEGMDSRTEEASGQAEEVLRQAEDAHGQAEDAHSQTEEALGQAEDAHSQTEEALSQAEDALRQIETKLSECLKEEGIRAYSTYRQGAALDTEEKTLLVSEADADLYLGLTLGYNQDKEEFGTYVCYNGTYFMPKLTNGTLADMIERELVTEISGRARGLTDTDEGILGELSIPAVIVCPGYMSHETEGTLLLQDAYQDKIAEGICQGVLEAYEKLGK